MRLDDLVAEHLDHLHYVNDILLLQIRDLSQVLVDHLLTRLFVSKYIGAFQPPQQQMQVSLPQLLSSTATEL
jgi:protein CLEC16A